MAQQVFQPHFGHYEQPVPNSWNAHPYQQALNPGTPYSYQQPAPNSVHAHHNQQEAGQNDAHNTNHAVHANQGGAQGHDKPYNAAQGQEQNELQEQIFVLVEDMEVIMSTSRSHPVESCTPTHLRTLGNDKGSTSIRASAWVEELWPEAEQICSSSK
ncbi:hypothetical protein BDR04DRAFT_1117531 [Suillus decipiens]|nr:hypothetical protein BDR04DRAFT_1117531 [Suillus decipiens]